jgi:NAD(P)-dependent dehydrogenase (short-subunit alcohol dehydrogenase family)
MVSPNYRNKTSARAVHLTTQYFYSKRDHFALIELEKDLSGKVVVVTGGAMGIGRATVLQLAEEGASVVVVDIDEKLGEATSRDARKNKTEAIFVKGDVTKEADVERVVSKALAKFRRIDALVNNAGVVLIAEVEGTARPDFDRVVDINFKGAFFCSKAVIPVMKKQGGGTIVNLASVSAHIGQPEHAAYAGTKGAVLSMTRAMAVELAPFNIRVNSVSPGAVDTPMLRSDMKRQSKIRGIPVDEVRKEFSSESVMKRISSPDEIAKGIAFLCSDRSSYMTGADILMDGGWVAK